MDIDLPAILHKRRKGEALATAAAAVVEDGLSRESVDPHGEQLRGLILDLKVAFAELWMHKQ